MKPRPESGAGRPASSTRPRFWVDPRFALGLVLVIASIVGVAAVVAGNDRTVAVYAAREPLTVGDRLDVADLVETRVRLGAGDALYLTPTRIPADGLTVTRTIGAGELVPTSAVGARSGESMTSLVVDLRGRLSTGLAAGSVVDVWSAGEAEGESFGPPAVLVGRASIVRILEPTGLIQSGEGLSVEVLVPKGKVAQVLEAIANEDAISIVAVNSPIGG